MPNVTYKGDSPIIKNKVASVINDIAFKIANFTMFQKIANTLSIISFVMVASMSGGAYFGYKYVTSENFKAKVMNEILGNVQGLMPDILDNSLPDLTGPSMNIPDFPKTKVHLKEDIHFHERLQKLELQIEEETEEEVVV